MSFPEEEALQGLLLLSMQNVLCMSLIAYHWDEYTDFNKRRNRCRRERYASLSKEERMRRSRKVPRISTVEPYMSPWARLYGSDNMEGFITVTGLDPPCFRDLLGEFTLLFNTHSPYADEKGDIRKIDGGSMRRGRPRKITAAGCLGLVLFWTRTSCYYWTIAGFFGLTGSPCELWLRFGKRMLLQVLRNRAEAKIQMPDQAKLEKYVGSIARLYPSLTNVAYVGDGLKILIEKSSDNVKQNAFYNGWKCDHFITNLFIFAPDGTIIAAILNCPGSLHDSDLARIGVPSIYSKLSSHYEQYGTKCVMDSAFAGKENQCIIKSIPRDRIFLAAQSEEQEAALQDALSVRQAAEWGMRALQGAMPRLKARWPYEEKDERLVGLTLITHLYNYKANKMDLNQIRSVYWNPFEANIDAFEAEQGQANEDQDEEGHNEVSDVVGI